MGKLLLRMLREIKSCLGQFLSLVLVIAVGSFMFTGLFATIFSINRGVKTYYEEQNMANVWVRFNGIEEETIRSLAVQMDMQAEGRYTKTFEAALGGQPIEMRLSSLTALNTVRLTSGTLPQNEYDVVVDTKFADANNLVIGSGIEVIQPDGGVTLTVCGIGNSPENAWKMNNNSSGVVKQSAFAVGYTTASTMKALIAGSELYAEKYNELMEEFSEPQAELLEAKSDLLEKEREFTEEQQDAQGDLDEAKAELSDANEKLQDAGNELDANKAEQEQKLNDARTDIETNKQDIADKQEELDEKMEEADRKFSELYAQIDAAQKELDAKQAELDAGYAQIAQSQAQLTQQRATTTAQFDTQIQEAIASGKTQEEIQALEQQKEQALNAIDAAEDALSAQKAALDSAQASLTKTQKELDAGKNDVDTQKKMADLEFKLAQGKIDDANTMIEAQEKGLSVGEKLLDDKIDSAQEQLEQKTETYGKNVDQLNEQEVNLNEKLSSSRESLDEAWETYYEKEQEFGEAKQEALDELNRALLSYSEVVIKTDDVDAVVALMSEQEHYVASTPFEEQASVKAVQGGMDIIGVVSYVFPIIFFLVAAMIAFISMSKMVENQRMQIAIMEAIGISKRKILSGYLVYSLLASTLGSFGFAALGNRVIPQMLTRMFTNRYIIPPIEVPAYWLLIVTPFALGLVFSGAATLIAARSVFREVPAQAMRPRPPATSKPILIERIEAIWRKLSYASKLNFRNIFLNKKKILLSSVGVLGCVTLVLMGLSIQTSTRTMLRLYQDSIQYDLAVRFEDEAQPGIIAQSPYPVAGKEEAASLRVNLPDHHDAGLSIQILPPGTQMVQYKDAKGQAISIPEKGILIPRSTAEGYGLKQGDTLKLTYEDTAYRMRIAAIAEQYVGNNCAISRTYADALGLTYTVDEMLVTLCDAADIPAAQAYYEAQESVKSVTSISELSGSAKDSLEMLNVIVKVIIAAAAILSVTVIYNITSIHIFERTRELATLMVLGYYKNEAGRLVFVENLVITGVGFLLGLPSGALFFEGVALTFQNAGIYLPHEITLTSMAFALGLVYALSIATNLLLKRWIRRIDMVEALKGVE